jgi:hypothetical protein
MNNIFSEFTNFNRVDVPFRRNTVSTSTRNIETACFSEMSLSTCESTRCDNPEEHGHLVIYVLPSKEVTKLHTRTT